jgi:sugar O-acyltransferase (sialic acid O-acetyltransferase NeuD family)
MKDRIIVAGSGNLTTEIYESALLLGFEVIILDVLGNSTLANVEIIRPHDVTDEFRVLPIIMGWVSYPEFDSLSFLEQNRQNRMKLFEDVQEMGFRNWTSIVHPSAVVSISAEIGLNVFVGANCTISFNSKISSNTRIYRDVSIGHDVTVGSFCYVAPGVTIAGLACIQDSVFIGAGSILINGVNVGKGASVGAGSLVTRDVRGLSLVMGSPARRKNLFLRNTRIKILSTMKKLFKKLGLFSQAKAVFRWWKS